MSNEQPAQSEAVAVRIIRRFHWPDWFHAAVSDNRIIVHGMGKFGEGPVYCVVNGRRVDDGGWVVWDGTNLHSAPPAPSVPDGWKLVPVEPTEDMEIAASQELCERGCPAKLSDMYVAWSSMIAAAPEPPK